MASKKSKLVRILEHTELSMYPLGRLQCARNGCRYCDEQVLEAFKIEVEVMAVAPEYEPCHYFNDLVDYVAFRKAYPLSKKGRPPQTDWEMIRDLEIGRYAEVLHRKGKTVEEALADTAEKYFGTLEAESKVRDARLEFLAGVKLLNEQQNQAE